MLQVVQGFAIGHLQARTFLPMTRSAGSISHSGCSELSGSPGSSYIRTYLHVARRGAAHQGPICVLHCLPAPHTLPEAESRCMCAQMHDISALRESCHDALALALSAHSTAELASHRLSSGISGIYLRSCTASQILSQHAPAGTHSTAHN